MSKEFNELARLWMEVAILKMHRDLLYKKCLNLKKSNREQLNHQKMQQHRIKSLRKELKEIRNSNAYIKKM